MTARNIFNLIIVLFIAFTFLSCSKDKDKEKVSDRRSQQDEEMDNPSDTIMTPEEAFSSAILIDYLNDSEDDDLADYLQTEIFKMGNNFSGVSVAEINPSTWLVMMEKDSTSKNFLLQKFLDVKTNESYFRMKETNLTITDVITKGKTKTSAGE